MIPNYRSNKMFCEIIVLVNTLSPMHRIYRFRSKSNFRKIVIAVINSLQPIVKYVKIRQNAICFHSTYFYHISLSIDYLHVICRYCDNYNIRNYNSKVDFYKEFVDVGSMFFIALIFDKKNCKKSFSFGWAWNLSIKLSFIRCVYLLWSV